MIPVGGGAGGGSGGLLLWTEAVKFQRAHVASRTDFPSKQRGNKQLVRIFKFA